MLSESRTILDRRVLAGIELVDVATGERVTAPMKVTALIVVAIVDAVTAYQGSRRPPRKKSLVVCCCPLSR